MRLGWIGLAMAAAALCWTPASARPSSKPDVQAELQRLAARTDGVLSACIASGGPIECINGERPMPMQSVMKLIVAIAVLDEVDRGTWSLQDQVSLHRSDISPFASPLAGAIGDRGLRTTVADLVTRAVIDSDSTAVDVLIARLGGPRAVQAMVRRKAIEGIRIDRDEKGLQTETLGLTWRETYASARAMRAAEAAVPPAVRDAAFKAYQSDPRDRATARGMTQMLERLAHGQLLSPRSTRFLISTMERTRTFPGRLKAGAPAGWRVAHKTGTSGVWRGVTAATNDVGLLRAPDGRFVAVAAFLANSRASSDVRDAALTEVSRIAAASGGRS
jgi:beta-lactamase class A